MDLVLPPFLSLYTPLHPGRFNRTSRSGPVSIPNTTYVTLLDLVGIWDNDVTIRTVDGRTYRQREKEEGKGWVKELKI